MSDAPAASVTENGVSPVAQAEAPDFKIFCGNLAYTTTDEGLRTFFAPVQDEILDARVILRGTRSAGYGFVSLSTEEAASKAVEVLHGTEFDGRKVIIEIAKPADQKDHDKERRARRRPGRRGGKAVPGEVSEAEANGEANRETAAPGDGEKLKKKKKKAPRKPRRKAAEGDAQVNGAEIQVNGVESTAESAAAEGTTPKKQARVKKPRPPRAPRPAGEDPAGEPSKTMLFVANLGFNVDDAGLATLFTDAGVPVVSARIVRRRFGQPRKSKGYGFVDVGGEEEQQKAIEALQGKEVGGRAIAVKIAVNTPREDEAEGAAADATADAS